MNHSDKETRPAAGTTPRRERPSFPKVAGLLCSSDSFGEASMYAQMIREVMARIGQVGKADPRHVEAWMRIEHSTLDGLCKQRFASEVKIALSCISESGIDTSESLAKSMGL